LKIQSKILVAVLVGVLTGFIFYRDKVWERKLNDSESENNIQSKKYEDQLALKQVKKTAVDFWPKLQLKNYSCSFD